MKFFIGPSRVRIPPRTQTQQKRGASVNFVIIFLVVSRSFKQLLLPAAYAKRLQYVPRILCDEEKNWKIEKEKT